jgi:two-component system nitrogen regulation response regulator GlnG
VERVLALTILGHAQASRIGERALLPSAEAGAAVAVSRSTPAFSQPAGGAPRPLSDPFLSRNPLVSVARRGGIVSVRRERSDVLVRADGADLAEQRAFAPDEIERGVVLEVGGRCALLLHHVDAAPGPAPPRFDLVGDSDALQRLRRDVARMAATDMRVLLRGETGSGKELVARAIHAASARAAGPYVAVNMGAIPPSLAASALFGHVRGAFSGAVADHDGHMTAAHDGTLFLDEIGDTDAAVQAMLLRALETSEVQRVGDRRARKVDVRLLSATDADLEAEVARGRFREPLLHRVGELTLRVPPLRERRDDVGRLVVHFLREALSADEQARLLDGQLADRPWLSAGALARLSRAPWTGNVRQLRNVVRQLVVLCRDEVEMAIPPDIEATLADAGGAAAARLAPRGAEEGSPGQGSSAGGAPWPASVEGGKGKRPQDLTEEEILAALAKTGWRRDAAAELLGIARSSLYAILAANPRLDGSRDRTREQILEVIEKHGGDVGRAAAELRMSEHGLKLRLQALGLLVR